MIFDKDPKSKLGRRLYSHEPLSLDHYKVIEGEFFEVKKKKWQEYISRNKIDTVIKQVIQYIEDEKTSDIDLKNEFFGISGQYYSLSSKNQTGTISEDKFNQGLNKIRKSILDFISKRI